MAENYGLEQALANRQLGKSMQVLTGIVTGIVADGALHDLEIHMLNTWLAEHGEVTGTWPGSSIAQLLRDALADGSISAQERGHLLLTLQRLVGSDFAATGAVAPEVAALPFDEDGPIDLRDRVLCFTGEFVFGTRRRCEDATELAGGITSKSVSKKLHYLVVGTHISPAWITESYGRKIAQAMELQQAGHGIAIVHERRWTEALSRHA